MHLQGRGLGYILRNYYYQNFNMAFYINLYINSIKFKYTYLYKIFRNCKGGWSVTESQRWYKMAVITVIWYNNEFSELLRMYCWDVFTLQALSCVCTQQFHYSFFCNKSCFILITNLMYYFLRYVREGGHQTVFCCVPEQWKMSRSCFNRVVRILPVSV